MFQENTVSGVNTFASSNKWCEGIDDDQAHVSNYDASPRYTRNLFASNSMLSNCTVKDRTTYSGKETLKIMINDHCLIDSGTVGK